MPKKSSSKTKKLSEKRAAMMARDLVLPDFARYFFVLAIAVVLILFFWVISPFFNVLIYASLIAIFFYPLHKGIAKCFKKQKALAAFVSTFLVLVLFLAPLTLFVLYAAQELSTSYESVEEYIEGFDIQDFRLVNFSQDLLQNYGLDGVVGELDVDVNAMFRDLGERLSTFVVSQTGNILKGVGDFVAALFIMLLTVYFFFKDGEEVKGFFKSMSPLPQKYEAEIEKKLTSSIYGIVLGNFGTAVAQGLVGTLGFAIAGIDGLILWGTMMAFGSLIPYVGPSVIWGPLAIYLLLIGDYVWGTFLFVWGFFVVSAVDNLVRPLLIGSSAKMHPLATFLVVLGGIFVFGLKGIIFGPLILSLALTIIHIYQLEYKEVLGG